jgi:hypothetical protein
LQFSFCFGQSLEFILHLIKLRWLGESNIDYPLETEYRIFKRLGQDIIETNDNGVKTYSTHPQNFPVDMLSPEEGNNNCKREKHR